MELTIVDFRLLIFDLAGALNTKNDFEPLQVKNEKTRTVLLGNMGVW
jgi:hypothetical protein